MDMSICINSQTIPLLKVHYSTEQMTKLPTHSLVIWDNCIDKRYTCYTCSVPSYKGWWSSSLMIVQIQLDKYEVLGCLSNRTKTTLYWQYIPHVSTSSRSLTFYGQTDYNKRLQHTFYFKHVPRCKGEEGMHNRTLVHIEASNCPTALSHK